MKTASLPGGPGEDVVQGAAAGDGNHPGVFDHQLRPHPVMGAVVVTIARVVALFEIGQDLAESLPAVIAIIGAVVDDDHDRDRTARPSRRWPFEPKRTTAPSVGLDNQVLAEGDCGLVGYLGGPRPAAGRRCGVASPAAWRINPAGRRTGGGSGYQ